MTLSSVQGGQTACEMHQQGLNTPQSTKIHPFEQLARVELRENWIGQLDGFEQAETIQEGLIEIVILVRVSSCSCPFRISSNSWWF